MFVLYDPDLKAYATTTSYTDDIHKAQRFATYDDAQAAATPFEEVQVYNP